MGPQGALCLRSGYGRVRWFVYRHRWDPVVIAVSRCGERSATVLRQLIPTLGGSHHKAPRARRRVDLPAGVGRPLGRRPLARLRRSREAPAARGLRQYQARGPAEARAATCSRRGRAPATCRPRADGGGLPRALAVVGPQASGADVDLSSRCGHRHCLSDSEHRSPAALSAQRAGRERPPARSQ